MKNMAVLFWKNETATMIFLKKNSSLIEGILLNSVCIYGLYSAA